MAPLILPLAALAFGIFWWIHCYLIVYVTSTEPESNGQAFWLAVEQLFVGLYFLEVGFTGLFLLIITTNQIAHPLLQSMCMVVMTAATILVHLRLRSLYLPVFHIAAVSQGNSNNDTSGMFRISHPVNAAVSDIDWSHGVALNGIQTWLPRDANDVSRAMIAQYGQGLVRMSDKGASINPDGSLELTE
jgi:hypothetical protein